VHSDADAALQAIKEHRPDLILMDLHLPGLDGMRLTALIRQQPGLQLLPIVFLSGDPDPERQFEVLDSGADDYLSKPIRPRHLIAAVANRIRRARAQAATLPGATGAPATSNPETGLPTRHHVLQQLNTALAHR
ncbi:response regulator, partial [Bradyrhizobium sp. NBAIM02]